MTTELDASPVLARAPSPYIGGTACASFAEVVANGDARNPARVRSIGGNRGLESTVAA